MRSIRLSLVLYFLVLLALALGAVSVLAYRNTEQVLASKEEIRRNLLVNQCNLDRKAKTREFDGILFFHVQRLADQARQAYRTSPSKQSMTGQNEIQFNEETIHRFDDQNVTEYFQAHEYFQVNMAGGNKWRSRSMAEGDRWFPFDPATFTKMEFHKPIWEETELESGTHVRRLIWKMDPSKSWGFRGRPGGMPPPRDGSKRPLPPPPDTPQNSAIAILIQCAADTTQRDAALAKLEATLENDLSNLKAESRTTLAHFRNQLLLISLATFSAIVAGGFWLVRLGLSPLHKLSEAVSKVSAKDFHLPFDEHRLPRELRPIVERLTETLDLLKRAFAREKQAAADISHDLRTPLASLLTTIEVALRKQRTPEEYREILSDCHAAGQQMNYLVERLLALARLDAGVDVMRPRSVDITNLAEQCATMVRPLAEARSLTLQVHRNGPIQVTTDPDKLREILTNLLHNAIEYNQPNGSIDLTVEQQNGVLQVEVRDTGIGIAPAAREHIFERFYRADASRHADGLHAGLGLAIVKGYVDLMGGTISVESAEGKGSTFRLQLPLQQETTGIVEHRR